MQRKSRENTMLRCKLELAMQRRQPDSLQCRWAPEESGGRHSHSAGDQCRRCSEAGGEHFHANEELPGKRQASAAQHWAAYGRHMHSLYLQNSVNISNV